MGSCTFVGPKSVRRIVLRGSPSHVSHILAVEKDESKCQCVSRAKADLLFVNLTRHMNPYPWHDVTQRYYPT